jgi:CrcB protein
MIFKLLSVGAGGFIGAALRYMVSQLFRNNPGTGFPVATLLVNVIGGLLIGFIYEITKESLNISEAVRLFLTTGILGGFTTFSTFSYETLLMLSAGNYAGGVLNTALNVILSVSGAWLGSFTARLFR